MKIKKSSSKKPAVKARKKPVKSNDKMLGVSDYDNLAKEYLDIAEQVKILNKRKTELSTMLKEGAARLGNKDAKGSSYLSMDSCQIGNVAKVTLTKNDEKGYPFLTNYRDSDGNTLSDCITQVTKYVVDEEALAEAVRNGRISMQEVRDNVYDKKVTYQVSVKNMEDVEEDMPEIEQSTLKKG